MFLRKLIAQTSVEEPAVSGKVAWRHCAGSKISANCQAFGLSVDSSILDFEGSTPFLRIFPKKKVSKHETDNCYSQRMRKLETERLMSDLPALLRV